MTQPRTIIPTTAWRAVRNRDPRFDGRFVFAVTTTGIFCRPSCPARRPHRHHVQFFASPIEATKSGFRPCRRCEPESAAGTRAERAIQNAMTLLRKHPDQDISLESLAREASLTKFHFLRLFKKIAGATPLAYQRAHRLQNLRTALRNNSPVTQALENNRITTREQPLGMTPTQYRHNGKGTTILYTTALCTLGRVLVATTDRGICAVLLGDNDKSMESELRDEFPAATIARKDAALRPLLRKVLNTIDKNTAFPASTPTAPHGTAFQLRVWNALRKIPKGQTRTYAQIAAEIGLAHGARAVARACATNRLAVLVPCHRVVRGDNKPSGYRWGLSRKSRLLETEKHQGNP